LNDMSAERNHIKVFVSSTVYDFENELHQIYALLDGYGYDVCMSNEGTIPVNSKLSNMVNCMDAVENCDVFVGIIRPLLGSGILEKDGKSITEQEFDKAFEKDMPYFVLADYRVEFAHKFLNLMKQDLNLIPLYKEKVSNKDGKGIVEFRPNLLVHPQCVSIYRDAIRNNVYPLKERRGNWVQPYKDLEDIQRHLEAQFKDLERIKSLL